MCDKVQETPAVFSLWIMERVYEQTLAFILFIIILLVNTVLFTQDSLTELTEFIKWIIILFAGQFMIVYVSQRIPNVLQDEEKAKTIFNKMIRFSLPLAFLLFLAIMVGQLFSEHAITIINGKNVNMIDLVVLLGGFAGFILVLIFKKDWTY
jgi:hypothetical protein